MPGKRHSSRNGRSQAEELRRGGADSHLPLDVAAAMAFHRVLGGTKGIVSRRDYDDALDIMATGLARLVPVYVLEDPREGRKAITLDLAEQAFVGGATRLHSRDGTELAGLTVLRSELASALAQFRTSGLPFLLLLTGAPLRTEPSPSPKANQLLAGLPEEDYARLGAHLELVPLRAQDVLYAEGDELRHVYFPVSGVVSLLYITQDGEPTEIAVIGNDGVVGLALLLGAESTPRRAVVQIAGLAYRILSEVIVAEFHRGGALQGLLLRYIQALITQMAQTAVCNRHHLVEQQLCRWLLLSLDRTASNEIAVTQEVISHMLGVRRSGISQAAKKLQDAGLLLHTRGRIIVPDRAKLEAHACECYAVVKRETDRLLSPHNQIKTASS